MMSKESKSIILHDDLTSSRSLIILLTRNHSVARSFQIKFDMKVINLHSYLIEQNNIRQNFRRTKFLFEQNFRSLLKNIVTSFALLYPAGTRHCFNVVTTSIQRRNIAWKL